MFSTRFVSKKRFKRQLMFVNVRKIVLRRFIYVYQKVGYTLVDPLLHIFKSNLTCVFVKVIQMIV